MATKKELEADIEGLKKRIYEANIKESLANDKQRNAIKDRDRAINEQKGAEQVIRTFSVLIDNRMRSKFPQPPDSTPVDTTRLPEEFHWLNDLVNRIRFRNDIM